MYPEEQVFTYILISSRIQKRFVAQTIFKLFYLYPFRTRWCSSV